MAYFPNLSMLKESDVRSPADLLRAVNAFLSPTVAALKQGLTISGNAAVYLKVLEITVPDDWRPVKLNGAWKAYSAARGPKVRKSELGEVEFSGLIKGGAYGFNIPAVLFKDEQAAYAPPGDREFGVVSDPYSFGSVETKVNGLYAVNGGPGFVSLAEVRYSAADRRPLPWPSPIEFSIPSSFRFAPAYIVPLRVEESTGAPVTPVSLGGWVAKKDSSYETYQVSIPRICGLSPLRKYRVTLAVLPG